MKTNLQRRLSFSWKLKLYMKFLLACMLIATNVDAGPQTANSTKEYSLVHSDYVWISQQPELGTPTSRQNLAMYGSFYQHSLSDDRYWSDDDILLALFTLLKYKFPEEEVGQIFNVKYVSYKGWSYLVTVTLIKRESGNFGLLEEIFPTLSFNNQVDGELQKTYGDANFNLEVTTNSTGQITYSIVRKDEESPSEYTGDVTLTSGVIYIVKAGKVKIKATVSATPTYKEASIEIDLIINKATSGLTIGGSDRIYNGEAMNATATTVPAGLPVNFVYKKNGIALASAPVNAGEYTVTVTVEDNNYAGSRTEAYIIHKATGMVDIGNMFRMYDGTEKAVVPTTTPANLATTVIYKKNGVALTGNPVDAGNYEVEASIDDENYTAAATGVLTIQKASAAIAVSDLEQQYDGLAKQVTVTTTPAELPVEITYNGAGTQPIAAGLYTVVATVNHENYTGEATATLNIIGTTAIGNSKEQLKLSYYPNPTERFLFLDLQEDASVEIISVTGQVLLREQSRAGEVILDLANLRTGQYILHLQTKQRQVQKKFIKR